MLLEVVDLPAHAVFRVRTRYAGTYVSTCRKWWEGYIRLTFDSDNDCNDGNCNGFIINANFCVSIFV